MDENRFLSLTIFNFCLGGFPTGKEAMAVPLLLTEYESSDAKKRLVQGIENMIFFCIVLDLDWSTAIHSGISPEKAFSVKVGESGMRSSIENGDPP